MLPVTAFAPLSRYTCVPGYRVDARDESMNGVGELKNSSVATIRTQGVNPKHIIAIRVNQQATKVAL